MQSIQPINWIDVVALLLLIRALYTGGKVGLTAELLRLFGTLLSIVVAFHYFETVSNIALNYVNVPAWLAQVIVLLSVMIIIRAIFKYGIVLLFKILNIQLVTQLERIGGAFIGLVRGFLICGFLFIIFLFIPIQYFSVSVRENSIIAPFLVDITKNIYVKTIKLIPSQQPNELILAIPQAPEKTVNI